MDFFDDIGDIGGAMTAINPVAMLANLGSSFGQSAINAKNQGIANDRMEQNHWEDVRITREDNNSAHQREVKDLLAAGLNPILSATKGAGSYSGTSPSLTAPQITAPDILPALQFAEMQKNNAMQRALTQAQIKNLETETDQKENSMTGALSKWWKGFINKDKSEPSYDSTKEKFKNWKPKTKQDWERERIHRQKDLNWPKGK